MTTRTKYNILDAGIIVVSILSLARTFKELGRS